MKLPKELPVMFGQDYTLEKYAFSVSKSLKKKFGFANVKVKQECFDDNQRVYKFCVCCGLTTVGVFVVGKTDKEFYTCFWQNMDLSNNPYNKPENFTDEQFLYTRLTQFLGVINKIDAFKEFFKLHFGK